MTLPKKTLSVFSIAMLNVIAIDSIRTLPITAEYGFSAVFYYVLVALIFFIPTALVAAELATGWPETGGVYVWVREAFGNKLGFMTIWLQWFYNICWYPTIMSLIAATLAYVINPQLVHSKSYMLTVIMIVFWSATFVNSRGMKASARLSSFAAIVGTLLPMLAVIVLGIIWLATGHASATPFTAKSLLPNLSHTNNLVLLTAMLYGYVGMEMSAAHAGEAKNPQRDYPKAMIWSVLLILLTMIFGTLAIEVVVPVAKLNIIAGLLQAFDSFLKVFHLNWLLPVLAVLIIIGAIGGAAAWMLSPSKGILMASRDGSLPASLGKLNKRHAPARVLLVQGVLFTIICSVFLLLPTVSSGFWALTDVTSILALMVYVMMFSSAIYLRYKRPEVKRAFKVPGGLLGLWVVCLLGLFSSVFVIALGFLPPAQIPVGNVTVYEVIIIGGFVVGCLLPFVILAVNKVCKK